MSTPRRSAPRSIGTPMTSTRSGMRRLSSATGCLRSARRVVRFCMENKNAENCSDRDGDEHSADPSQLGADQDGDDHRERLQPDALTYDPRRDEMAFKLKDEDEEYRDDQRVYPSIAEIGDRRRRDEGDDGADVWDDVEYAVCDADQDGVLHVRDQQHDRDRGSDHRAHQKLPAHEAAENGVEILEDRQRFRAAAR